MPSKDLFKKLRVKFEMFASKVLSAYYLSRSTDTKNDNITLDATFLLTIGSFLLTVELFYLQLCLEAFLLTTLAFYLQC